jgi:glucosamine-6-phosphate deaminase
MEITVTESFEESCQLAARQMIALIREKPTAKLGLATGTTAEHIYPYLVESCRSGEISFWDVRTVNLDEYRGLAPSDPNSYRSSMDRWLFDRVDIRKENTYVADGMGDPDEALREFREKIADGAIDFQLLGIGANGHIGFNEAGDFLEANAHIASLRESTIAANARFFGGDREKVPKEAYTMGVGDIFSAKSIVLVISDAGKAAAAEQIVRGGAITPRCPATILKLHGGARVILHREIAQKIGYGG